MALVSAEAPSLSDVLVFYGPATRGNSTQNSSRIQAHIYSLAGFQTFPCLTISPNSPLYAAVYHLPADQQGDQICRGIAISLLNYFSRISKESKAKLKEIAACSRLDHLAPSMFDEMHAGDLASRMVPVENVEEVKALIESALAIRSVSWIDMDVVLPPGTIRPSRNPEDVEQRPLLSREGLPHFDYGELEDLIGLLGSPTFLPTSKLRRAPSRPTRGSKTTSLLKEQKIALRQHMCELADTEERYVSKIEDLVHRVAGYFRDRLIYEDLRIQHSSPNVVDCLFPGSLYSILELNRGFNAAIQELLQSTENDAISDIEGISNFSTELKSQSKGDDSTGAISFAKELLHWFPKFMDPYQEFMRASVNFPSILHDSLQDKASNFPAIASEIGEQWLRASLIEPVQRLPRYSLFIDNMVKLLPASHQASSVFLMARDIITDICALDSSSYTDNSHTIACLKSMIRDWPPFFSPYGRLISAIDVRQLDPPYVSSAAGSLGILLLFPQVLVLLRKSKDSAVSARNILAEIDCHSGVGMISQLASPNTDSELIFKITMELSGLHFVESKDGRLVWFSRDSNLPSPKIRQDNEFLKPQSLVHVFALLGTYECKARRFCEEVVKARTEGRFSETVRDSGKWALRTIDSRLEDLSVLAAIWENHPSKNDDHAPGLSQIRMAITREKAMETLCENLHLKIAICVAKLDRGTYQLHVNGSGCGSSVDEVQGQDLVITLLRRLAHLIQVQSQKLTPSQLLFHRQILRSIPLGRQDQEFRLGGFRPISPVKLLSNILGGGPLKYRENLSTTKEVQLMPPQVHSMSSGGMLKKADEQKSNSIVTVGASDNTSSRETLTGLEDTLAAYLSALRSRSGNVIGKVLSGRSAADELSVNRLYNTLLEDPFQSHAAAQSSVDVLFVAFEKFLKSAWRDQMGPILPADSIEMMQSNIDAGKPAEFSRYFKHSLGEMTPQSRRALIAIVKLISDLLDASGNDGDRGVLIASFAEALIPDGKPHDYIMLLDRLVDDFDNLFDGTSPSLEVEQAAGSNVNSLKGNRSINAGSVSSNSSSLRKRFGLGTLSRENSKSESESKVASVWRTLSKHTKTSSEVYIQPVSLSRASLVRSRSTDTDTRMIVPLASTTRSQPLPREHQPYYGNSRLNQSILGTIGEVTPTRAVVLPKKKRRSSLSDLNPVHDSATPTLWPSPRLKTMNPHQERPRALPRTPSPRKNLGGQLSSGSPQQSSGIPQRVTSPQKFSSPGRKENSPLATRQAPVPKMTQGAEKPNPSVSDIKKPDASQSGIPAPKAGLSERTWPPNGTVPSKKLPNPPLKLRIQSPQKLRERLNTEQKAISSAEISLKSELDQIGKELATYKIQRSPTKTIASTAVSASPLTIESLSTALSVLSESVSTKLQSLNIRVGSISSDLESSLVIAEKKSRKLDELYREANAENEALYERFNDELEKIVKGVRVGNDVEEFWNRMRDAQGEIGRLKRENAKLRREVVGLRSMVQEG